MKDQKIVLLYFAWLIALIGVILSFYFGEVLGKEPCRLCWYQRMSLFPLFIILGIASYRGDARIYIYALPLSCVGMFFALAQVLERYFPSLSLESMCGKAASCNDPIFTLFDFLTLPLLSFFGFFLISLLLIFSKEKKKERM